MREIKFRAWDGEKMSCSKVEYFDDMVGLRFEHFDIDCEKPTLMQYTGLKDKNRKEIYEGDICYWRDLETFNGEILEDTFVVVWNDEKLAWCTQNEDGNFGYDLYEYTDDRDLEVIGNIYENVDLLEVKE